MYYTIVPFYCPCQVLISTKDVVAAAGKTAKPDAVLFSKDGKLKKELGDAHKGWRLISVKSCLKDTPEESLAEAKQCLTSMYDDAGHEVRSSTFVFGRQNLDTVCG
jgi:hypothetical protein